MDKVGCDAICKSHSARSDRDQFRICPTKLSKQELEDLYFAVVETNLELKKSVNEQQDRIKMLSTKMQRLSTAQKIYKPEGRKDCCVSTKAVVSQQKELIADLKCVNERMADRIRRLNMRLCSAKQFCKSATPRCLRCSTATSPYLIKQSSHNQRQQSQSTLKLAASCHNLSRNTLSTQYTQTEAIQTTRYEKISCEDNKCRSVTDELKQKIINLQEELTHTNEERSAHNNVLQVEMEQSRIENVRVRSEKVAIEQELLQRQQKNAMLTTSLRAAEGLANELKTQLSIEKRKVAELETRLKVAIMSNRVTESIENTLTSIQESHKSQYMDVAVSNSPRYVTESNDQHTFIELSTNNMNVFDETRMSKSTDDSGYLDSKMNEKFVDDESLNKIMEELTKRILVLQTQVDTLTISPPQPENDVSIINRDFCDEKSQTKLKFSIPNINEPTLSNSSDESIRTIRKKPKDLQRKDSKTSDDEIKPTSPKKCINNRLQVPDISINGDIATTENDNSSKESTAKIDNNHRKSKESSKNSDVDINKNIEKDLITSTTNNKNTTKEDTAKVDANPKKSKEVSKKNDVNTNMETNHNTSISNDNVSKENTMKGDENAAKSKEVTKNIEVNTNTEINLNVSISNENMSKQNTTKNYENITKSKKVSKSNNVERNKEKDLKRSSASDDKTYNIPEKDKDVNYDKNIPKTDVIHEKDVLPRDRNKLLKSKSAIEKPITKEKSRNFMKQKTISKPEAKVRTKTDRGSYGEATYTLKDQSFRSSSPDDTDYEISSMTDLSEEREPKHIQQYVLSPGEHKFSSTQSESHFTTDTTNYSLSEGEIPTTTVRRRSNGDISRLDHGSKETVPKMEETLQAISEEITRCKRLLYSQRSQNNAMSAII